MNDKIKEYLEDERRTDYIPLEKCKKGYVYKIHSRNLSYGVYDGNEGFIGIREKFGDRYLFTEYHYDQGAPYGTVKPFEEICELPSDIPCNQREIHHYGTADWAVDPNTNEPRPVLRRDLNDGEMPHGSRKGFVDEWADTKERLPENKYPYIRGNKKLFQYLEQYNK